VTLTIEQYVYPQRFKAGFPRTAHRPQLFPLGLSFFHVLCPELSFRMAFCLLHYGFPPGGHVQPLVLKRTIFPAVLHGRSPIQLGTAPFSSLSDATAGSSWVPWYLYRLVFGFLGWLCDRSTDAKSFFLLKDTQVAKNSRILYTAVSYSLF